MGAQLVKEAASKTSDVAGDGTTTATVLAEAIFKEGLKNVTAGARPDGHAAAASTRPSTAVVEELDRQASPVKGKKEIAQVATIAANNDAEIGEMIAEAMEKVGKDGVITVEEGKSLETTVDVVEGMQFDRGYLCPHFVTDPDAHGVRAGERLHPDLRGEDQPRRDLLVPLLEKIAQGEASRC